MLRLNLSAASLLCFLSLTAGLPAQEAAAGPAAPAAKAVVVYDFEVDEQIRAFAAEQSDGDAAEALYVFGSDMSPNLVGGRRSLYVVFRPADDGWAATAAPVRGADWAGATALSFWINPFTEDRTVTVALVAEDGVAFECEAKAPEDGWQRLELPLESFVAADGRAATSVLDQIAFLKLVKRGPRESCSFRLDQIEVVTGGSGETPDVPTTDPTTTGPTTPPTPDGGTGPTTTGPTSPPVDEPYAANVSIAFTNTRGACFMPYLGANVLPGDAALLAKPEVAQVAKTLEPMVRTIVNVPPSPTDDPAALTEVGGRLAAIARVSKERGIVVCLQAPVDGTVSAERYGAFAEMLARQFGSTVGASAKLVRYWELLDSPVLITDADYVLACKMANTASKKIRAAEPDARIGGMSFFAAQEKLMKRVLQGTKGAFSFLSWHFYGASMASVSDEQLFESADTGLAYNSADVRAPDQVLELLKVADMYETGFLFVSECNVNNVRSVDGKSQDARTDGPFAAAWLASYLVRSAPVVDVVLLSRLVGDSWGMIRSDGSTGPLYWTARLFREHFPRGGQLVAVSSNTDKTRLQALGAVFDTHKALLLVNRANRSAVVGLDCTGFGGPVRATLVGIDGVESGYSTLEVPAELSTRQVQPPTPEGATAPPPPVTETRAKCAGITLPPYGVAVVEFRSAR